MVIHCSLSELQIELVHLCRNLLKQVRLSYPLIKGNLLQVTRKTPQEQLKEPLHVLLSVLVFKDELRPSDQHMEYQEEHPIIIQCEGPRKSHLHVSAQLIQNR